MTPGDVVAGDDLQIHPEVGEGVGGFDSPVVVPDDVRLVHLRQVGLLECVVHPLSLGRRHLLDGLAVLPGRHLVGEVAQRDRSVVLQKVVDDVPPPPVGERLEQVVAGRRRVGALSLSLHGRQCLRAVVRSPRRSLLYLDYQA